MLINLFKKEAFNFFFFNYLDEKPYWFDVEKMLDEYQPLVENAFANLKRAGNKWVNEKIEDAEDIVKKFTYGKMTLVCY